MCISNSILFQSNSRQYTFNLSINFPNFFLDYPQTCKNEAVDWQLSTNSYGVKRQKIIFAKNVTGLNQVFFPRITALLAKNKYFWPVLNSLVADFKNLISCALACG